GGLGGKDQVLVDSSKDDFTIDTVFPSHAHTNWAFSKPGVYKFDVTYTATTTDGKKVESEPQELLFTIGDEATNNCAKDKPAPKPEPKPQPKPEKEGSSAEGSSFNPWSLVLPLVLATIFQAALNFIHDHRAEIDYWVKGITGR
ncbi:choice-of-anchor M domain-containing protein, partial [Corynebacterium sp. HMSC071F07]